MLSLFLTGHIFAKSVSQKKVVIDLVLVHKDCRNKGIGTKLMQHAMDCYKGYTFNLVSVEDKNGFYEKFGFKVTGHKLYRAKTHPLSNKAVRVNAPTNLHRVKDVDDKISAKVISFGTSIFGQDTSSLLKCMHRSESNKWLSVTDGDDVEGFLVYKQVKKTCRICVFGAKSLEIAKLLLQETIQRAPAESKYRIGFSLTNKVLYSEVYSRLLQNGVVWDTTEDILSTGECIEDPENWPMMFGIFHYCFIKSHLL